MKIFIVLILLAGISFLGYSFYSIEKDLKTAEFKIAESQKTITFLIKEKMAKEAMESKTIDDGKKINLAEIIENYNKESQLRKEIIAKSENIKGIYITKHIANANSKDLLAKKRLDKIKELIEDTQLNGVVIDVKDESGFQLSDPLRKLIDELHKKNVWVIARVVAFRDSSLIKEKPELYLKREDGSLWQEEGGYFWLDPASFQVQKYIIDLSEEAIDFGFDEIQFDYVRFPPKEGSAVYPAYDRKEEKQKVIRDFYLKIRDNLREHNPDIILSVDLFGETATKFVSPAIGQSLTNAIDTFDYISFMLYPGLFFGGFEVGKDTERNLPRLYFPAESENINDLASNHPYEVVLRSIFTATDFISSQELQPQCVGGNFNFLYCPHPKIRPWLQDFDLSGDVAKGIVYDAEKVKAQIRAAEDSQASGWLLWNPSNIYTEDALNFNNE